MATNLGIITRALRLLNVVNEVQTPSAEQGSHALTELNAMLERWTEDGIELGYFAQSTLSDECPIPAWAEQGVVSRLAQVLSGTYPAAELQNWIWDDDRNGYGTLLRKSIVDKLKPANMNHLPHGSGKFGDGTVGYDITIDSDDSDSVWV